MSIQKINHIFNEAVSNEVRTLELRVGQIVRGVVMQQLPNQEAVVNINGVQVKAKLEIPILEGQAALMQVSPDSKGSFVHLRQVDPSTLGLNDPMKDILRAMSLPEKGWASEIIKDLRREGFPLNKETAQAFTQAARMMPSGVDAEGWMQAAAAAFKRGMPMTATSISSMHQLLSGTPMHQLIHQLQQQLQGGAIQQQGTVTSSTVQLLQQLSNLLNQQLLSNSLLNTFNSSSQQSIANNQTGVWNAMPHLSAHTQQNQMQGNVIQQMMKWLGVQHEQTLIQQLISRSDGSASNQNSSPSGINSNQANLGQVSSNPAPQTQAAQTQAAQTQAAQTQAGQSQALNTSVQQGQANAMTSQQTGIMQPQASSSIAQSSSSAAATQQNVQAHPVNHVPSQGGAQASGALTAAQTQAAMQGQAGPISTHNDALVSQVQQQSASGQGAAAQQPSANPSAHSPTMQGLGSNQAQTQMVHTPQANSFQTVSDQAQANVNSQGSGVAQGTAPTAAANLAGSQANANETLKASLMTVLQATDLPVHIKETAQQLLHAITGQQMMLAAERNHSMFSHVTMYIPIHDEEGGQTATIHVQTRRDRKGELDAENCRIVFDLNMNAIGPTLVDMNIVNKIVSLNIWNDSPIIGPIIDSLKPEMIESLQHTGYLLSSVKATSLPKKEELENTEAKEVKVLSQPPDVQHISSTRYKGVDFKI